MTRILLTDNECRIMYGLIQNHGRPFQCAFFPRTSPQVRIMRARPAHTGNLPYDPEEKGLLPVVDLDIEEPRNVNLRGLMWVTLGKRTYFMPHDVPTFERAPKTMQQIAALF